MSGKKIEFVKKPSIQEANQFIDNWVSGNTQTNAQAPKLQRTTIYLPEELHKRLKIKAASEGVSMTDIIISSVEKQIEY